MPRVVACGNLLPQLPPLRHEMTGPQRMRPPPLADFGKLLVDTNAPLKWARDGRLAKGQEMACHENFHGMIQATLRYYDATVAFDQRTPQSEEESVRQEHMARMAYLVSRGLGNVEDRAKKEEYTDEKLVACYYLAKGFEVGKHFIKTEPRGRGFMYSGRDEWLLGIYIAEMYIERTVLERLIRSSEGPI
ncbi:MAG: hypothetical protein V1827_01945 [Candidatus Micrarchaeota archaeon]